MAADSKGTCVGRQPSDGRIAGSGRASRQARWCLSLLVIFCLAVQMSPALVRKATAEGASRKIHMPIAVRAYPPLPEAPALWPVDNTDGDGNYVVSWQAGLRADSYELEEQWQGGEWFRVYSGSALQAGLNNRPPGAYVYRCRALNSWGYGVWSNLQSVNVPGAVPGTISRPPSTRVSAGGKAVVKVVNDCPYVLHVEFTGQQLQSAVVPLCPTCHVYSYIRPFSCPESGRPVQEHHLEPGPYRVYVWVEAANVGAWVGHWQLEGDRRYLLCMSIVRTWGSPSDLGTGQVTLTTCDR